MSWLRTIARRTLKWLNKHAGIRNLVCRAAYRSRYYEWLDAHPCPEFTGSWQQAREDLWEYLLGTQHLERPIHYLEFGVYQGDSIRWWTRHNTHTDSRFVGFDSFQGLPEEWNAHRPRGHFSTQGRVPDIGDPRCTFKVGLFHDTLPAFVRNFSSEMTTVVHLDADLYSSTLYTLCLLEPALKLGDILIFDEFSDVSHEFRAFVDFVSAFGVKYEPLAQANSYEQFAVRIMERSQRSLPTEVVVDESRLGGMP